MPKVTLHNMLETVAFIASIDKAGEFPVNMNYTIGTKRSLSQNALQHCIYAELSRYLISKGRTDCTAAWIKQMLKNKFLGWVTEEFTDITTGEKFTKDVLRHTADLTKGESCHYTTQIIEWSESIGCSIKIPADSEYMKYLEQQNA